MTIGGQPEEEPGAQLKANGSEARRGQEGSGEISAVVVDFASGDVLRDCVTSLLAEGVREIVVVDNAGALGALGAPRPLVDAPMVTDFGLAVRVVQPTCNLGFGAGANFGAALTTSPLLLVCNPDIVVQQGALQALASRLSTDPTLGLVGPALVAPDGATQPTGRRFPTIRRSSLQGFLGLLLPGNSYSRRYLAASRGHIQNGIVDWVTGACMLIRRAAFDEVGGFDGGYFMYVEEVDLCWRLSEAGWRTGFEASATVVHHSGVSTSTRPYAMLVAHHRSLLRFASRTARGVDRILVPGAAVGIVARMLVALAATAARSFARGRRATAPAASRNLPLAVRRRR